MSTLFKYCCCGETGECFFGYSTAGETGEDWGFCTHKFADQLILTIPRPSFTTTSVGNYTDDPAGNCEIYNPFQINNTATGANSIVVRYKHYESNSRLYNWKYYSAYDTLPPCQEGCWGYADLVGLNDSVCCDNQTPSRCSSALRPLSPIGNVEFMSELQNQITQGTDIPKLQASSTVCTDKDFGDGYRHFEGIAGYGGSTVYEDWRYNDALGVWTNTLRKLAPTMWIVLHRTKWWERYYNSIHPNDCIPADCETGVVASCRTPQYWDYECAGFPIFTWELYYIPDEVVSLEEKQSLWTSYNNDEPMDQDILDKVVAYLDKEPRDLSRVDDKVIYTELEDKDGNTGDLYSYARLGGWKSVCYDQDNAGVGFPAPAGFPQWTTNYSGSCSFGGDNNCFTAAPIPQETTCSSTTVCARVNACDGAPTGSSILYTGCDVSDPLLGCAIDTAVGDCSGVWFGFFQHCNILPYSTFTSPYNCCIHNEAFLCVVPDGNSSCDCSELPQLGLLAPLSPLVSAAVRNNQSDDELLCCGQKGTFAQGNILCDCVSSPNTRGCTGPEDGDFCVEIGT